MSTKISELPDAGALTGGDELVPIVQDGDTVKTTVQDIADYAGSSAVWGGITGDITDQTDLVTALNLKVDAVPGKGLSANDFTNTLKTKLDGIQDGAEVNVNADWNATSGDAQILNKPTIPSAVTNTSELINDGADGVNPFITALDIPTAGQAGTLVREVKNMTGATLTKGTVVYISGANGNKALVSKARANAESTSARTFGLLQSDILDNGLGYCVVIGDISGLDTSAFTEGAQLYLSGTVAGEYTSTKTLAPTHLVYVGKVTRSHPTMGQIEVQIQNGYELDEIHDVAISSPANNDALVYESSSSLWKNKPIIQSNPFPLFGASITSVPGAATPTTRFIVFLGLTPVAIENQRQIPVPYDVTFKNFFCFFGVGASQPATGSLVLTIRKNGVDTAITITIPAGTSIGTFSDTTNSVSFVAGDLISVKAVNNALATSGNITSITLGTI